MGKFKMKGLSRVINSPLNVESKGDGETTWNPEEVFNVSTEKVDGGFNTITDYLQTGESTFDDSKEILPNEVYAKLKQDPNYIKKELEYINRNKPLEKNRTEVEFTPDLEQTPDLNQTTDLEQPKSLKQYFYATNPGGGSPGGFGNVSNTSTGKFASQEDAFKYFTKDNYNESQYYEMYDEDDKGNRNLVQGGETPIEVPNRRYDPKTGKIIIMDGKKMFTRKRDKDFPNMNELYKNIN